MNPSIEFLLVVEFRKVLTEREEELVSSITSGLDDLNLYNKQVGQLQNLREMKRQFEEIISNCYPDR